jgi:hypothetical protein
VKKAIQYLPSSKYLSPLQEEDSYKPNDIVEQIRSPSPKETKKVPPSAAIFDRDKIVSLSVSAFVDGSSQTSNDSLCPSGGSGGLVCCPHCSRTYSDFLSQTAKDVELQKTRRIAEEAKGVMRYIEQGRKDLEGTIFAAKRRVPPGPGL